ncbi:MbtH family NRPS accessory protein [Streptomyces sp. NPDC048606]|uniref:MbtH family protein n=1 Tax=Streptomyces sp. NPDC048606 TaxID=3154726 RepID=UPI003449DE85
MANLFDDADGEFVVLVNADRQFSLWPGSIEIPPGWDVVSGPAGRRACLDRVEADWRSLRPASLSGELLD